MKRLQEFRVFYNHTIFPELVRMERNRKRLVRLLAFSVVILIVLVIVQIYANVFLLTLFLTIPISFYVVYVGVRIRRFQQRFKPNIIKLILDFLDNEPNYGKLFYDATKQIEQKVFYESGIFGKGFPFYQGEDFISGRIGEMNFELSELDVRRISPVSNQLEVVFRGIFITAIFNEETEGSIIIWPRHKRPFISKAIKDFTWEDAINVDDEILNPEFKKYFTIYATKDTHVVGILSDPMQVALMDYINKSKKDIYLSFVNEKIYAAISSEKDLLEPNILSSNLSFQEMKEFYEDIELALLIIRDFDQTH